MARGIILAALLALTASTLGRPAVAQVGAPIDETSWQTATGQVVQWSAPWTLDAQLTHSQDGLDIVILRNGPGIAAVVTGDIPVPDNARGLIMGYVGGDSMSLTFVDAGSSDTGAWWLDIMPMFDGGDQLGVFTIAQPTSVGMLLTMLFSPIPVFGQMLAGAQAAVQVDGAPVFPGVDASLLQGQLGPGEVESSPVADPPITSYANGDGRQISWAAPWSLDETRTLKHPDYDVIFLVNDTSWVVVATGNIDPGAARGLLLGSIGADPATVAGIDAGSDGASSYWFDYVPLAGVPSGAFTSAVTDPTGTTVTLTMYIGPQSSFAEGIAQAQAGVAIDGVAIFEGVDGGGLQSQLLLSIPSGAQVAPSRSIADPAH